MNLMEKPALSERRGATTLWRMVARTLEQEIHEGRLPPGTRLSSEIELAARFDVHRNTVRRALSTLRDRDLIRVEQGRGAFVKERTIVHKLGATTRLSALLAEVHRIGERRFIGSDRLRPDKELVRHLSLGSGHFVRKVDTVTVVEGTAIAVSSSYFPLPRFEGIEHIIKASGSFSTAWREYGVTQFRRLETRITSVGLSREDADILDRPRGLPTTLVTNTNIDAEGRPIVWSRMRIIPHHMELVVRYD